MGTGGMTLRSNARGHQGEKRKVGLLEYYWVNLNSVLQLIRVPIVLKAVEEHDNKGGEKEKRAKRRDIKVVTRDNCGEKKKDLKIERDRSACVLPSGRKLGHRPQRGRKVKKGDSQHRKFWARHGVRKEDTSNRNQTEGGPAPAKGSLQAIDLI